MRYGIISNFFFYSLVSTIQAKDIPINKTHKYAIIFKAIEEEKLARAEKEVSALNAERERRLEEAKSEAEKKEIKADITKRIRKIRDDARLGLEREIVPGLERLTRPLIEDENRYYRIMEALSKETHLGGYLLRLSLIHI